MGMRGIWGGEIEGSRKYIPSLSLLTRFPALCPPFFNRDGALREMFFVPPFTEIFTIAIPTLDREGFRIRSPPGAFFAFSFFLSLWHVSR